MVQSLLLLLLLLLLLCSTAGGLVQACAHLPHVHTDAHCCPAALFAPLAQVLWWGFACFPAARLAFVTAYYTCGVVSIWAALRAQTAVGRGLPMLALLLVRLAAFGARLALEGWAGSPALHHYFAMEVRWAAWLRRSPLEDGSWGADGLSSATHWDDGPCPETRWLTWPTAAAHLHLPASRCSFSRWPAAPSTC